MTISFFKRVANTVGKGENAGDQHFLPFPQCFLLPSSLVSEMVWKRIRSCRSQIKCDPKIIHVFQQMINILGKNADFGLCYIKGNFIASQNLQLV